MQRKREKGREREKKRERERERVKEPKAISLVSIDSSIVSLTTDH